MFCIITTHAIRRQIQVVIPGVSIALLTTCFIAQKAEEPIVEIISKQRSCRILATIKF